MITAICVNNINPYSGKEDPNIIVGYSYEVKDIHMGQSSTSIEFKDKPGYFNSVCFEFFEDGKHINIYKDKRFNPYLKWIKK